VLGWLDASSIGRADTSIISLKKVELNLIKAQQPKIGLKHEASKNKIKSSCLTP